MPDPVTVILPGKPVAWARARRSKDGPSFTAPKQAGHAKGLGWLALEAMRGRAPMDGPLEMTVGAFFPIPKRWTKAAREAAIRGEVRPTHKYDIDNIAKQASDALTGIVYVDDGQIVDLHAFKKYAIEPMTVVTVAEARGT